MEMKKFASLGRIRRESAAGRNAVERIVKASVFVILASGASAEGEPVVWNGIAAQVNGRVITKSQVAILVAPDLARLEKRFPNRGPEFEKLLEASRKAGLQQLIDQWKLIDQFNQPKVPLPADAVEEEMKRVIRDDYEGDANKLREALRKNRMTLDGFRDMLRAHLLAGEIRLREAAKKR